jgi:hypothetical protein
LVKVCCYVKDTLKGFFMPISPSESLSRLGRSALTNAERQDRLARTSGVHVGERLGQVARNYRAVGPVTARMQDVDVDLRELRRTIETLG